MILLAIDPGNATGWATLDTEDLEFDSGEIPSGLRGFVKWWCYERWDSSTSLQHVFVEDFVITPTTHRKTPQPHARYILGYVQGKAMESQYRSNRNVYCTKIGLDHKVFSKFDKRKGNKLIGLGWDNQTKDDHANSAASVLLRGVMQEYPKLAERILS